MENVYFDGINLVKPIRMKPAEPDLLRHKNKSILFAVFVASLTYIIYALCCDYQYHKVIEQCEVENCDHMGCPNHLPIVVTDENIGQILKAKKQLSLSRTLVKKFATGFVRGYLMGWISGTHQEALAGGLIIGMVNPALHFIEGS